MKSLLLNEITMLLWYVARLKSIYDQGGKETVKHFRDLSADSEEYELLCLDKLETLPECTYYEYLREETEDSDELGEIYGEKWIFESAEMRKYYNLLTQLKCEEIITDDDFDLYLREMIDYILQVLVDKQYNDGGFYCHFDDGTETGEACRIELFRYQDGSFGAFDAMCGILAIFEKYKERLSFIEEEYIEKMKRRKENGT